MDNKKVSIGIGIALVILIGGLVWGQKSAVAPADTSPSVTETTLPSETPTAVTTEKPTAVTPTVPAPKGITRSEVAAHSSRQSCWSTINGNVYDLTSWIPKHPGGEEGILKLCGVDGSAKYDDAHGGAAKQAAVLFGFKIGVAAQ